MAKENIGYVKRLIRGINESDIIRTGAMEGSRGNIMASSKK